MYTCTVGSMSFANHIRIYPLVHTGVMSDPVGTAVEALQQKKQASFIRTFLVVSSEQ